MNKQELLTQLAMRKDTLVMEMAQAVIKNDVESAKRLQGLVKRSEDLIRYTKEMEMA
jgi:hypothetical protein